MPPAPHCGRSPEGERRWQAPCKGEWSHLAPCRPAVGGAEGRVSLTRRRRSGRSRTESCRISPPAPHHGKSLRERGAGLLPPPCHGRGATTPRRRRRRCGRNQRENGGGKRLTAADAAPWWEESKGARLRLSAATALATGGARGRADAPRRRHRLTTGGARGKGAQGGPRPPLPPRHGMRWRERVTG